MACLCSLQGGVHAQRWLALTQDMHFRLHGPTLPERIARMLVSSYTEPSGEYWLLTDMSLHLHTIFTRYAYGTGDFLHALVRREAALGAATIPKESLVLLCTLLQPHLPDLASSLLWHEASVTAAQTQQLLPAGVAVQKSVTVQLCDRLVLVTGVGDFRLQRDHRQTLAKQLSLPRRVLTQCTINPGHIDPQHTYGLLEGMVSPFFARHWSTGLSAIASVPTTAYESALIAISLSRYESLLVPQVVFPILLQHYARLTYPDLRFIHL